MNAPMKLFLHGLVALFAAGSLHAHRDTIIRLEGIKLVGLPEQYAPAELDLKKYRIRIKDHVMEFTDFLKSLCEVIAGPEELKITASWYHTRNTLPPYMNLALQPKGKDFSYEILLNLDTLDVIEIKGVLRESKNTTRYLPIELGADRRKDIARSIKRIK